MDSFKNLASVEEEEDDDEEEDEDYVPNDDGDKEDDDDDDDGDSSDSEGSEESDDGEHDLKKKKKKKKRRGRKRKASACKDDAENVSETKEISLGEKKRKADDLWAELNDSSSVKSEPKPLTIAKEAEETKVVEKIYDFAGEKVVVKETPKAIVSSSSSSSTAADQPSKPTIPTIRRSGLKDLVSNLGKKNKLGTLQKTKIDWDSFKRDQGIEDELKQATLSKDGFVERQAFLSRADVRQFEIEKEIRSKIRKPQ